jgi:hypothetical protein
MLLVLFIELEADLIGIIAFPASAGVSIASSLATGLYAR